MANIQSGAFTFTTAGLTLVHPATDGPTPNPRTPVKHPQSRMVFLGYSQHVAEVGSTALRPLISRRVSNFYVDLTESTDETLPVATGARFATFIMAVQDVGDENEGQYALRFVTQGGDLTINQAAQLLLRLG
jgi:hypothetical protein